MALRLLGALGAGAAVAGLLFAGYAALHAPSRDLQLGAVQEVAAPAPATVTAAPARGSVGPGSTSSHVAPAWVTTYAGRTGIPARALQAYADASLRAPCRVGWTTLAGIGWVESQHGTIDGGQLGVDGRPLVPILGPALNGRGALAAVPDGGGEGWARAEGPLQFLPSTWATWATDGDGDGVADPQDIDDASLTAARYLCAAGVDLGTGAGWDAAIHSYNHSDDYVRSVYAAASAYAERSR